MFDFYKWVWLSLLCKTFKDKNKNINKLEHILTKQGVNMSVTKRNPCPVKWTRASPDPDKPSHGGQELNMRWFKAEFITCDRWSEKRLTGSNILNKFQSHCRRGCDSGAESREQTETMPGLSLCLPNWWRCCSFVLSSCSQILDEQDSPVL